MRRPLRSVPLPSTFRWTTLRMKRVGPRGVEIPKEEDIGGMWDGPSNHGER